MFSRSSLRRAKDIHDLEMCDKTSKSLLANVLDMDDDSLQRLDNQRLENNFFKVSHLSDELYRQQQHSKLVSSKYPNYYSNELVQILKEIRYIADRMRKDDDDTEIINDWK